MPDPHWENLKEIFHAAVALVPNERAAYLDRACNGNTSLRQTVQSMIKSHEETGNFVDTPAYQAAAEMLVDGLEFKSGQTAAHLEIDDALEIAIQVASARVAAHRVNIVHRDIKPENIMIRRDDGLQKCSTLVWRK